MLNTRIVSPLGEAQWPFLQTPDTKFNPEGVYRVNMVFERTPEVMKFIDELEKILNEFNNHVQNVERKKVSIVKPVYEETDDGKILLKFKQNAKIIPKDRSKDPIDVKIAIFDKFNRPLDPDVKIGNGSKCKIAFMPVGYHQPSTRAVGLTLRIVAVQVRELVTYGDSNDGATYGFDAEQQNEEAPFPFDAIEDDNPSDF